MYWFPRPPYLRYALAAAIVVTAIWVDLRPTPTERYPFARTDLAAGTHVDDGSIEWRSFPAGFATPPPIGGPLRRSVDAGEPLRASDFASDVASAPDSWWALEVELPAGAVAGQPLRLVVIPVQGVDPPPPIPAVVISPGDAGGGLIGTGSRGLVAVPPEHAAAAATAVAENRVTVLLGSVG